MAPGVGDAWREVGYRACLQAAMARFTYVPESIKHSALVARAACAFLDLRNRGVEKYLFTATTGRSGTLALARLFEDQPGCRALHEPYPVMNGEVLHDANFGQEERAGSVYQRIKAVHIRRAAAGQRLYLESNHQFIKSFIEPVVRDLGERVEVIHLVRDPVEVAMSIFQLEDGPGTEKGNFWWLDHRAPANRIRISGLLDGDAEFSHPFYKALWYWHEVEARVREWKQRLPGLRFHRFETEWLNDPDRVLALFRGLRVRFDAGRLLSRVGAREHVRTEHKGAVGMRREQGEQMRERFEAMLQSRGMLPDLPPDPGPAIGNCANLSA